MDKLAKALSMLFSLLCLAVLGIGILVAGYFLGWIGVACMIVFGIYVLIRAAFYETERP